MDNFKQRLSPLAWLIVASLLIAVLCAAGWAYADDETGLVYGTATPSLGLNGEVAEIQLTTEAEVDGVVQTTNIKLGAGGAVQVGEYGGQKIQHLCATAAQIAKVKKGGKWLAEDYSELLAKHREKAKAVLVVEIEENIGEETIKTKMKWRDAEAAGHTVDEKKAKGPHKWAGHGEKVQAR